MMATEREYRYRLFSTPNVTSGPEVAEFITKHSEGVLRFKRVGTAKVIFDDRPPFDKDSVEIMNREEFTGDTFSIVLANQDLWAPVFWYQGYSVVSRGGVRTGSIEGPDLPIYAYLTLLAVAGWESYNSMLRPLEEALPELGPHGWLALIQSGRLPVEFYNRSGGTNQQGLQFRGLITAVDQVLKSIAQEASELHIPSTSRPDTNQQAPEVTEDSDSPTESSANESIPKLEARPLWVHQIVAWLEQRGLPKGAEIISDLHEVMEFSDLKRLQKVVNDLNNDRPEAGTNLMALIAESDRPSAENLLKTLVVSGHPEVAALATSIRRTRRGVIDPAPPDPDTKGGSVTVTPEPISMVVGTNKPTVKISPRPIGVAVAPATSEYDKPVDALGYRAYANALGDLITHPKTGTPLTVAVCGKWGSGKTTLMDYIKDRIDEKTTRSKEFVQIDFNAWEYSKSDAIWAAFYSVVLKQVETGLGWFKRWQFHLYVKWKTSRFWFAAWILLFLVAIAMAISLKQDLSATMDEGPPATNQTMPESKQAPLPDSSTDLVVTDTESVNGSYFSSEFWTMEQIVKLGPGVVVLVTALWNLFVSLSRGILGKVKGGGGEKPLDQESVIKLMERISKWLERNYRTGRSDKWYRMKIPKRFVIYIDDIDRVEPDKIMLVMEAINRFLGTPGFVFVLCMDARVVRKAIGVHYNFMSKADGDSERWGHHYLEKIIQIPFYLPKINLEGMMSLKNKLLGDLVTPFESEAVSPDVSQPNDTHAEPVEEVSAKEQAPSTAEAVATDKAPDQPAESEEPAPSVAPPEEPAVDPSMEMELKRHEDIAFEELFLDGLEMAPRLMVRLKNVYLLARHIYLMSDPEKEVPPAFTKWIALSIRYPFDAKKVVEASTGAKWPDTWKEVTDHYHRPSRHMGGWSSGEKDPFGELAELLYKHIESPKEIQQFVEVTNLFNLVLE